MDRVRTITKNILYILNTRYVFIYILIINNFVNNIFYTKFVVYLRLFKEDKKVSLLKQLRQIKKSKIFFY